MAEQSHAPEPLTWGVIEDEGRAVFAPSRLVQELRELRTALDEASTWDQFRKAAPSRYVAEVHAALDEEPSDDAAFDASEIPGYEDGEWPEWLHQKMLTWMPTDLAERYGKVEPSVHNGHLLTIDPAVSEDLAAELEARGYTCKRSDEAIAAATGWD